MALAGSLLLHYLLAGGWPVPGSGRPAVAVAPQLHAQLELPAEPTPVPLPESEGLNRESAPAKPSRPATPRIERQTAAPASETQAAANPGPAVPDSRFFPARELDRYPAPLVPLNLRDAGGGTGIVRAWVGIDLAGQVVDVALVDAGASGVLQRQVREYLLTVRFTPGIKDERPVRSRILMELVYGQ